MRWTMRQAAPTRSMFITQAPFYVLEGSIVMQMKGEKEVTLHPGETFYEDPDGVHLVGRNASDTKPARFVVLLVKNKGAPILIPTKE